jgi:hypothetical protein
MVLRPRKVGNPKTKIVKEPPPLQKKKTNKKTNKPEEEGKKPNKYSAMKLSQIR